jgi:parallel beta-helix repeat protein
LLVTLASGGNTIRRNRLVNNGSQQWQLGRFNGAGIQTGGGNNTRNEMTENEVTGNDWGITIGAQPDSANLVANNRVHDNRRGGIVVYGQHNRVENNDATGNSLVNLMPNCGLDLAEFRETDNTWLNNRGRFGSLLTSGTPGGACP